MDAGLVQPRQLPHRSVGAACHVQPYVTSLLNAASDSPSAASRRSRSASPGEHRGDSQLDASRLSADQSPRVRQLHSLALSSPASQKQRARMVRVKVNVAATAAVLSLSRLDASPIPSTSLLADVSALHTADDSFGQPPPSRGESPASDGRRRTAPVASTSPDLSGIILPMSRPRSIVATRLTADQLTSSDLYASGPLPSAAAADVGTAPETSETASRGSCEADDSDGPWARSHQDRKQLSRRLSFGQLEIAPVDAVVAAVPLQREEVVHRATPSRNTPRRDVWRRVALPDGRVYYYNVATRATSWALPAGARLAGVHTPVTAQRSQPAPVMDTPLSPLPVSVADASTDVSGAAERSGATLREEAPHVDASRLRILKSRLSRSTRSPLSVTAASDGAASSVTVLDIAQRAPVACASCGERMLGAEALCTHLVHCTAWHAQLTATSVRESAEQPQKDGSGDAPATEELSGCGGEAVTGVPCPYCTARVKSDDLWRHMLTDCHAHASDVSETSTNTQDDATLLTTAPVDASTRMAAAAARALFSKSR